MNAISIAPHLAAVLLALTAWTSGCGPACPVGTTNEGSTCSPAHDHENDNTGGTVDHGNTVMNGVATGGSGGLGPSKNEGSGGTKAGSGGGGGSSGRGMMTNSVTGAQGGSGGAGSSSVAGSGGAAQDAGGGAGAGGEASKPAGEPCSQEGAARCADSGEGARESCRSGIWSMDAPCPDGDTCTMTASGAPACQPLSKVCMASGQPITCDAQGVMLKCNPNGTAMPLETCRSAQLCQAGLAAGRCAACMPGTVTCSSNSIMTCDAQGQSMARGTTCSGDTPICNADAKACVQCKATSDCKLPPDCAEASSCSSSKCVYTSAYTKRRKAAIDTIHTGPPPNGGHDPVYLVVGNALFWVSTPDELEMYYNGFGPLRMVTSLSGYRACPDEGTLIRERGNDKVYISTGYALKWVKSPDALEAYCGGFANVNDVPQGSLDAKYPATHCPHD